MTKVVKSYKDFFENLSLGDIGGMGAVVLPNQGEIGSGDVPAGRKKKKKKKTKDMKLTEQKLREIIQSEIKSLNEAKINLDDVKEVAIDAYDYEIYDETKKSFFFDLEDFSANVEVKQNGEVNVYSTFEPFSTTIKKAKDIHSALQDFEQYYDEQNS